MNKIIITSMYANPIHPGHVECLEQSKELGDYLIVIVNNDGNQIGLVVDNILSQQQILIKGLQDIVKGTKGCAGATILGDGKVALILDVTTLLSV